MTGFLASARIKRSLIRKLIPAAAIAGVLAFSALSPVSTFASNGASGYINNCGVHGSGYHDHGKVCPNRPFPGRGTQ
jgi:hypothetical protein